MPNAIKKILWAWFACMIMYGGTLLFVFAVISIMLPDS